ncbi:hypothetical protein CDD83_4936 [Cordyceps sp. RAO-2017]|nr:hypothetical protein CDD83_4936 [Cordyceps sp. RAO-2017]
MSLVWRMNTAALVAWHDREGYLERLIRHSYQANWDMLSRSVDTAVTDLDGQLYELRLRASVSKESAFAWLAISMLLTVSAVTILKRDWTERYDRQTVAEGVVAALLTEPKDVLEGREKELNKTPTAQHPKLAGQHPRFAMY